MTDASTKTPLRLLTILGAMLMLVAAALAWYQGRGDRAPDVPGVPLPIGPTIPDFSLTESSGRTVTLRDLQEKVWVADFIFTRCSGPCPTLSAKMQAIQRELADQPGVVLVTFTLDPLNDTPSVLADYARRFHARPDRWWFLTGDDQASMHALIEQGLKQTVIPAQGDQPIIHSEYLVIMDRQARLRAAHGGLGPDCIRSVVRDVRRLLAEPPASP